MTFRGHVQDGRIVLDDGAHLADGVVVRVEVVPPGSAGDSQGDDSRTIDALARMGDLAVQTGVTDLAANLDHYLYGHPKAIETDGP